MSDDSDAYLDSSARRNWGNYEMPDRNGGNRRRHRGGRRRQMPNSMDKQEALVGMGTGIHPGGITDNEGFITDMVSTSSSGSSMGSNPWERGKQFAGQLS